MKNKRILSIPFTPITILLCCLNTFSQTHFEGTVTYDMTISGTEVSPQLIHLLPDGFTLYVKGSRSRLEISSGMSEVTVIGDNASGSAVTLMDLMGKKLAIKTDSTQVNEALDKLGEYRIVHVDGGKQILGYACKKAFLIRQDAASADTSTVWYTEELPPFDVVSNQFLPNMSDWFPMEVHTRKDGTSMIISVQEIKKNSLETELFEVPPDYHLVDQEEMRRKLTGQ